MFATVDVNDDESVKKTRYVTITLLLRVKYHAIITLWWTSHYLNQTCKNVQSAMLANSVTMIISVV